MMKLTAYALSIYKIMPLHYNITAAVKYRSFYLHKIRRYLTAAGITKAYINTCKKRTEGDFYEINIYSPCRAQL